MSSNLTKVDTFCVMPWVHLHIHTNGDINVCCVASKPFGNINSSSIKDVWHGNELNEFRKKLLNNIKDERCNYCYSKEEAGGKSLRQHSHQSHSKHIVNITIEDWKPDLPVSWDVRFSNICNFRCRTCYHGASSRWFDEAVKMGENQGPKAIIRAIDDLENFYLQIEETIDCVEEIYFAGGEPLIMDEHYRILEILEAKRHYDLLLRYNTNFSTFRYKEKIVFDIWKKFKRVKVWASLDGWGKRGEFLRKEQKWDEVIRNRELMKQICPNVGFSVGSTVSVFNILHIPDLHKELVLASFIEIDDFWIDNLLLTPAFYSIQILPFEYKVKVREKFEEHIVWINSYLEAHSRSVYNNHLIVQFRNCIDFLFAADLSEKIPAFISKCEILDELRSERTVDVFPELQPLFLIQQH